MGGMTASVATRAKWQERVQAWRTSGESARAFAEKRGYAPATLRYWSSRLGTAEAPRFLRLVPKAPPATASASPSELVVEVGAARVRVAVGFDPALLADLVTALGGGVR
jgi:hypothetical protein